MNSMSEESKKITKLEKLYEEAKQDFNLTILNISEKSREVPALKNKWCFKIVNEEKLLKKMEDTLEEMVNMYIEAHRGKPGGAIRAQLNVNEQEDISKLKKQIVMQKDVIRFLQLILDNQIKTYTWDIKNAIEQRKLESI